MNRQLAGGAAARAGHGVVSDRLRLEQAPLIGREAELETLTAALNRALEGRGGVCLLRGETGAGKTRLAEAALAQVTKVRRLSLGARPAATNELASSPNAEPGAPLLLRGKATERETPLTYEAITSVLRHLRRRCGLLTLERCSERLAPYRPVLAALLPEWRGTGTERGSLGDRAFLFEAVCELLRELLERQPVCLFLDDAHWMDQNSLELLQYLTEGLAEERFALLLCARDEEPNPSLDGFLAELRRAGRFSMWMVRRLGREATRALAEAWLEVPPGSLDAELVDYLYRETAGNSFYLQEVISGLLEAGALERVGDRFIGHVGSLPIVTGGMISQIQNRIARLDPLDRAVLAAASALGETTALQLLQAVIRGVTGSSSEALPRSLEQLERRRFLAPDDRDGEVGLRFVHPKVRQAVYHSLSTEERLRWHREAARVLRALPASHPAHSSATIGYHLSMAEEAQEAVPFLLETANRLLPALSFADAAWNLQRAERHLEQLKLVEPDHWVSRNEGDLWLLRGHLYFGQGRLWDRSEAFLRAWECVKALPTEVDPQLKATCALFRGHGLLTRGDLDGAEAWFREQRPLLEEALGGTENFLYLHHNLIRLHGDRGQWAERQAVLREGQRLALAIDSEIHVRDFTRRLHEDAGYQTNSGQGAVLRRLLDSRAASGPHPLTRFRWHWFELHEARQQMDWNRAHAAVAAMLTIAEEHRHRPCRDEAAGLRLLLCAVSEPGTALPDLRAAAAAAAQAEDVLQHGQALAALAAPAVEIGAWEEAAATARALLQRAESAVAEPARHGWRRQALLTLAEAALVAGRPDEAREWLEQTVPEGTPPTEFWAREEPSCLLAWVLAEMGDPRASDEWAAALPAAEACSDRRLRAMMQAQLAHAAVRLGNGEQARQLFDAARPALQACGSRGRLALLEKRLLQATGGTREGTGKEGGAVPGFAATPQAGELSPVVYGLAPALHLRVRLFGGFEVAVDGRTISPEAWGSRKARNLFKYLLLRRGRPVLTGDLLEEFWPDLIEDGARHALRSTLHRMRRTLEPARPARAPSAFLQVADDTVCLRVGPETQVDLYQFEDCLSQARRREAQDDADGAGRLREEAIAIYAGDLLPQDLSEPWALGAREGLREQYLSTLAWLAEAALGRGEPAAALSFAERMLETDPTHEPGIRLLVRTLAALDRGAEAVRRFDLFALQMERELGLIPERETRELVERLRRGR